MSRKRKSNAGAGSSPKRHAKVSFSDRVSMPEEIAEGDRGNGESGNVLSHQPQSVGSSMPAPSKRVSFPTIDPSKIIYDEPAKRLGSGTFADVLKSKDGSFPGGLTVAVKVLKNVNSSDLEIIWKNLRKEAKAMQQVEHENLCRFYGISSDLAKPFLVMEYIPGCTLKNYVAHKDVIIEKEKLRIALEIANGLEYLHKGTSKRIVHGDLHPNNIMVQNNRDRTVKIVDFGLARSIDGTEGGSTLSRNGRINPRYAAPEIAEGVKENLATDVYAFGGVVNFIWTKKHPWVQVSSHNVAVTIMRLQILKENPQLANDSILHRSQCLSSCWDNEASSRPTITECKDELQRICQGVPVAERLQGEPTVETIDWRAVKQIVGEFAFVLLRHGQRATTELNLSAKKITDEGIRTIAPALRTMTNLERLNLSNNHFGDEGCRTIAPALRTMTNLKELKLYDNNIGDEGLAILCSRVLPEISLEYLILAGNKIGNVGCQSLLELFNNGSLPSLFALGLSFNPNISSELKEVFKRDWNAKRKHPDDLKFN